MKAPIILIGLFLSTTVLAGPLTFDCKKVINSNVNVNEKAYTLPKSADLILEIDLERKDAEVSGDVITKKGRYHREDDKVPFWSYYTDRRRFKVKNDVLTVTSREKGIIFLCGGSNPCRQWESLNLNLKTGEAIFSKSHSYHYWVGEKIHSHSFKVHCAKR